jgi:hypothetical protein
MKFTKKQEEDIETCLYFLPTELKKFDVTEEDKRNFLDISEKGIKSDKLGKFGEITSGLDMLVWGKVWRGRHCDSSISNQCLYEAGILDGSVPYFTLLGGDCGPIITDKEGNEKFTHLPIPFSVKEYMKKSLFKGRDAELIENCYQEIMEEFKNQND